uniref:Nuclear pore complex protein n=1 Tax=Heterorhabditis bacteriophora TaxID=37862 RepID=A0A1I7XUZ1_HETBA
MDDFRDKVGSLFRIEDNKLIRELLAECIGTFFLLLIGTSANVQSAASVGGNSTSCHIAWGIGFMFAIYLAATVSGANINPAISFAQWVMGNIPIWKVVLYSLAQLIGAYLGAAVSYFGHHDDLWILDQGVRQVYGDHGTAGLFTTFPTRHMSTWGSLLDQVIGTAILSGLLCLITDKRHKIPAALVPPLAGGIMSMIAMTYGTNGGFAINPARDLGPRLFTLCAGYGWEVFSFNNYSYFWIPIVGPFIGALIGAWLYKLFIGLHGLNEVLDLSNNLKGYNNDSLLANLIVNDREFRMVYTLWRWCQENAMREPQGFADLATQYNSMSNVRNIRSATIRNLSLCKEGMGADFDSPCVTEDTESMEKAVRIVFSLVRCGRINEAIRFVTDLGASSLAPALKMYSFLTEPSLSPLDVDDPNYKISQKRVLFIRTMETLVEKSEISPYLRMLWAALSGRLEPLLSLATRTEDRLWCFANAAVNLRISEARGEMKITNDVPITIDAIFDEIVTDEKWPYYSIYGFTLRNNWAELIDWMVDWTDSHKTDDQLIRFMAHIAVICRWKNHAHDLLKALVNNLLEKSLFYMIPFYATLLPDEVAKHCLLATMNGINSEIESEIDRIAYLDALKGSGFDRDFFAKMIGRHISEHVRRIHVNDQDDYARIVLREVAEREVLNRAETQLRQNIESDLNVATLYQISIKEHHNHNLLFEAFDSCEMFSRKNSELEAIALRDKSNAENEAEDWRALDLIQHTERTVEHRKREKHIKHTKATLDIYKQRAMSSCEMFLRHTGWRTETSEVGRCSELSSLRDKSYFQILQLMISTCNSVKDYWTIMEMAGLIAEKELGLCKDLSKENLRIILEKIHSSAGHLLS